MKIPPVGAELEIFGKIPQISNFMKIRPVGAEFLEIFGKILHIKFRENPSSGSRVVGDFRKNTSYIKFHENPSTGSRVVRRGLTDGQTWRS